MPEFRVTRGNESGNTAFRMTLEPGDTVIPGTESGNPEFQLISGIRSSVCLWEPGVPGDCGNPQSPGRRIHGVTRISGFKSHPKLQFP
jgi:hypothetical protein